jgi:hypothetical protein
MLVAALDALGQPPRLANRFSAPGSWADYHLLLREQTALVQDGQLGVAASYVVGTLVTALTAVWLGMLTIRAITRRKS